MTLDEIRKFQRNEPFHPFEVVLVDGRIFPVPHPDFILIPPKGTWIFITDDEGATEHINTVIISSVRRRANGRGKRKAG